MVLAQQPEIQMATAARAFGEQKRGGGCLGGVLWGFVGFCGVSGAEGSGFTRCWVWVLFGVFGCCRILQGFDGG